MKRILTLVVLTLACGSSTFAAEAWGLKPGTPELKSAAVLAFGPQDILFVGDTKSATVFAIATGDTKGDPTTASFDAKNLINNLSDMLGGPTAIKDLVANPRTGNLFLACVTKGKPNIVHVTDGGRKMNVLNLSNVPFSSAALANAPEDKVTGSGRRKKNNRADAITDLAFYEGKLLVSGLQTIGSPSSVREIDFPFAESDKGIGVQIFHAAHGREEDNRAMRTFVPLMIDGEPTLLGAYVCTPLVKIPLNQIGSGSDKVTATTVAELGNHNAPLDMVSYNKDGNEYLLLSNSARGVMKITTAGLSENKGLTKKVSGGGAAGQSFETVKEMDGVVQMTKLNDTHAAVLIAEGKELTLKTVALP